MSAKPPLPVVLCWHMHQPQYLDPISGRYRLPWTYLHGIKDYVDMAGHLERVEDARAVVNFTPTLLEQLDHYAEALRGFCERGSPLPDPLLAALAAEALPSDPERRVELIGACMRANEERVIARFEAYRRLAEHGTWLLAHPHQAAYVSDQYLYDLLVWYHLAWTGETVRRSDVRVRQLMDKGGGYDSGDRRLLVRLIGELLEGIVPRYRRLAEQGRVELSVTPYAHPIVPLLLDPAAAREAVPDLPLPAMHHYPGGLERARWHIREGLEVFERHFGFRPRGCWPAEGGISAATLPLLAEAGFRWTASGGQVLQHSRAASDHAQAGTGLHRPYRLEGQPVVCFFRDDGLSDLIGFEYSSWNADDAVANLVHHLENIARACDTPGDCVVSIILDGENAWEYYPDNGYHFLDRLYRRLAEHPQLALTTFGDCIDSKAEPAGLARMVAGSWVYGNFSTWVGHPAKNRGWDMLADAKGAFDEVMGADGLDADTRLLAERQLGICEGSDWFWWFGDDNPAAAVRDFDELYREHLSRFYQIIGRVPPEYLAHAFTRGGGRPAAGGVMRPGAPASG